MCEELRRAQNAVAGERNARCVAGCTNAGPGTGAPFARMTAEPTKRRKLSDASCYLRASDSRLDPHDADCSIGSWQRLHLSSAAVAARYRGCWTRRHALPTRSGPWPRRAPPAMRRQGVANACMLREQFGKESHAPGAVCNAAAQQGLSLEPRVTRCHKGVAQATRVSTAFHVVAEARRPCQAGTPSRRWRRRSGGQR